MATTHLAFDLGAGSGRALLGTLAHGRLDIEEVHRFPTPLQEYADCLTWDLETLWEEICTGYEMARQRTRSLSSLSVDSWGCDYVSLDRNGVPLRDPFCYRDSRTSGMMQRALEKIPGRYLYYLTGTQFMDCNTLCQVLSDQILDPKLTTQTATRVMIADYFLYRFSGRLIAERTLASTSQLLDIRTGTWSVDLLRRFDLGPKTWPAIVPPTTPIGHTPEGVIVAAGCSHDTAAAVAAIPSTTNSLPWAFVSSGTWSLLGVERQKPLLSDTAFRKNFTNETGSDDSFRFLKNLTGLWVLKECQRTWQIDGDPYDYPDLVREASTARSLKATLDLDDPCFSQPSDDMPDRICQYCREHALSPPSTIGETVRLILESLAHAYGNTLRMLEEIVGQQLPVLHIVGGGSRNDLLCQMTANACGCTVVTGPTEAAGIGNLLMQARAVGSLPDGSSIRDVVRASTSLISYQPTTL